MKLAVFNSIKDSFNKKTRVSDRTSHTSKLQQKEDTASIDGEMTNTITITQ